MNESFENFQSNEFDQQWEQEEQNTPEDDVQVINDNGRKRSGISNLKKSAKKVREVREEREAREKVMFSPDVMIWNSVSKEKKKEIKNQMSNEAFKMFRGSESTL